MGTMIRVNGVYLKDPSFMSWGIKEIVNGENGRVEDGTMFKNVVAVKRKLSLGWNYPNSQEIADILQAFKPQYVKVTYHDAMDNELQTRTFYCTSDLSTPVQMWTAGKKLYSSITIDLEER
ncbi:MAG: hypothetical protein SO101_14755 [Lachnospiraceae bacterium]|nr:hypothetical protein [Lachnospiraceae bacterium]